MDFSSDWNIFWTVTFTLIATVVTAGNLLTISVFLRRKLLNRARYLLLSLAIADTCVGAVSAPLYIAVGIHPQEELLVLLFQCVDMFTGMVSIFTLTSISVERLHAVLWPFRHCLLTSRFYICVVGIPWVFGLIGVSSRLLYHFRVISSSEFLILTNTFLLTPLLITTTAYVLLWRKLPHRPQNEYQADNHDKKLAKTLFILTAASLITWSPHQVLIIVSAFCKSCRSWPYKVVHIVKILQFINSFTNVIIYSLRISEYRQTVLPCTL